MRHYILVHMHLVIDTVDELEGLVYVAHAGTMLHRKSNTWSTSANSSNYAWPSSYNTFYL